jgi:hypothetical protein
MTPLETELLEFVKSVLYVSEHGPFDPSPLDENSPLMDEARRLLDEAASHMPPFTLSNRGRRAVGD